ncbi:MAG TPA: L-rhamnose mutarotase [Sphingomonas sp.]
MRHVLFLDLLDDPQAIDDYRHWHRPGGPPAAVTRSIRESGIEDMEIWQAGDRLVMVMESGPGFSPAAKAQRDAADPDVQAWERMMERFQRRLPFAKGDEKWVASERIYSLAEQPADGK